MEKNRVTIHLAGLEFKLKVDESEEHMQTLAAYINSQVSEIQRGLPNLAENRMLLLAMLNMADEHIKLKGKYEALDARISALKSIPRESTKQTLTPAKRPFENKPVEVGAEID